MPDQHPVIRRFPGPAGPPEPTWLTGRQNRGGRPTPVTRPGDGTAADEGAESPPALRDFTHWPLSVGRVETRDGLTFVHAAEPDGFTAADHRRIPDDRVELLDGVAVIRPGPTPTAQRAVVDLYAQLCDTCPGHLDPVLGPLDVPIGPATVFRPDMVVRPRGDDGALPVLVVEVVGSG